MIHTSDKSVAEVQIWDILKNQEEIIDDNYLPTKKARKLLDAGYKILEKCKELRESRDKWRNKFEELKK